MHTKEQLLEMHSEHNEWQNKINFYRDEIKGLNKVLSDMVTKSSSPSVLVSVEHFQNQFILQNEVLDIMRHDFKQHENVIEAVQKGKVGNTESLLADNHDLYREKLDQFGKIFHDLHTEFKAFTTEASQLAF